MLTAAPPHLLWRLITDFGDSAVTVPLALFCVAYLLLARRHRAALALALSSGGAALVILLLKLALQSCLPGRNGALLTSPSGHAALSASVYGGLALLLSQGLPRRPLLLTATALLVAGIAASRLALKAHTPPEILLGLLVGGGFALLMARLICGEPPFHPQRGSLLALAALILLATYGLRSPAEQIIRHMAHGLHGQAIWCDQGSGAFR